MPWEQARSGWHDGELFIRRGAASPLFEALNKIYKADKRVAKYKEPFRSPYFAVGDTFVGFGPGKGDLSGPWSGPVMAWANQGSPSRT